MLPANKNQPSNSQFILYQDDNGVTNVNVRFDDNDVWLSQQQIALLFDTTHENVVQYIRNIYQDTELQEERTCKNLLQVQTEGNRSVKRSIPNYYQKMEISQKTKHSISIVELKTSPLLEGLGEAFL